MYSVVIENTLKYHMKTGIEVNSLSLQSSGITNPRELVIPTAVTTKMLENSEKALKLLDENIPNVDKGISLHASSLIDIKQVKESNVPISSVDTPDLAYPKEFVKTLLDRPGYIPNHLAWRLNSAMCWSKKTQTKRDFRC